MDGLGCVERREVYDEDFYLGRGGHRDAECCYRKHTSHDESLRVEEQVLRRWWAVGGGR